MQYQLGDRMKQYEVVETNRTLDPKLPIYARLDGRSFSKFTRGMHRPFDTDMQQAMVETTKYLVQHTNAHIGFTQSDEISLVWWIPEDKASSIFFAGKIQKMVSVLASMATSAFIVALLKSERLSSYVQHHPHFDARVFQLPSKEEAVNAFLWRELDGERNAISNVARCHFSAKELHKKNVKDMQKMLLKKKNVTMDDFPDTLRRGTYVQRRTYDTVLHGNNVMRSHIVELNMPRLISVENRVNVFFNHVDPIVSNSKSTLESVSTASTSTSNTRMYVHFGEDLNDCIHYYSEVF